MFGLTLKQTKCGSMICVCVRACVCELKPL